MSFFTSIWNYVDALVPTTVRENALTAARYRAFIAPHLLGSLAALATLPLYLVLRGAPSGLEVAVFAWLAIPIFIVCYLSHTGRYEAAHMLASLSLTCLAFLVALFSGGIGSFAAIWLVVVPFAAALSGSRRAVLVSAAGSIGAALLLLLLGIAGLLPRPQSSYPGVDALAIIAASLYATGLALGVESLVRTGERLLVAEEGRYRFLAQNATDVVVRCGRSGSVVFASPAAATLFGAAANELAGSGLFDRVHVTDRPAFLAALADAAESAEEHSLVFRVRCDAEKYRPGRMTWVEMRCRRLGRVREDDIAPDVVVVLRDISERKAQEDAIESARLESEHRSAAKSRFIATVGHELRTPLNAIIGFSEILTNGLLKVSSAHVEYAKLINDSGRHLLSVVNGILDASKIEAGHFQLAQEPFAPAPVIENVVDLLTLQGREAGIDLRLCLAQLPDVVADRRAFSQILINLVSNAIKFTPRGGCVTVSGSVDGPKLVLAVEDTGVGIGQDDLPRLGEAFFQTRSSSSDRCHDGSGLGLSIVKSLVKLHDGEFDICSRLGEGTQVTVKLPLSHSRAVISVEPVKFAAGSSRSNLDLSNGLVKKSA